MFRQQENVHDDGFIGFSFFNTVILIFLGPYILFKILPSKIVNPNPNM